MKGYRLLLTLLIFNPISATAANWLFTLEGGALYQTKSDVQIPPDTGTRFSLIDAIGKGPLPYWRMEGKYAINDRHRVRLLIAPFAVEQIGRLDKPVVYHGNTFSANTDTTYRYQFNSYRLSYAYRFFEDASWSWDAGFTAKIRDAEIALTQGNTRSSYPNIGFVPLLHLAAEKHITSDWNITMDLDAAWSPYGRAEDFGLFVHYRLNNTWQLGAGYRTVEGGADVDRVYNFAWFHYAGLRLLAQF
ncbi:MAG: hypothetical protein OEW08_05165 [Gammaproteobacteria bacterium]|nr:hypothetical protein [Gammaproteobacteria bacterium]